VYCPQRKKLDNGRKGEPVAPLWQFHPHEVDIVEGGYEVAGVEIPSENMLHLRGEPPYVGGHGNGVITRHGADLGLAAAVRKYAAGTYTSGIPAGYLKSMQPHMEEQDALDLKRKWMDQHGTGARSIAVLNATTEFHAIAISPIDAQLDSAKQWSLRDTALAFGVPSYMLGVPGDHSTYANVESRMIELRQFTLLRWIRRIESALDAEFPRGTELKIQTAGLERADTATRYAAYKTGIDSGFLTVDEVRALEDRPPLDPGNYPGHSTEAPAGYTPPPSSATPSTPSAPPSSGPTPTTQGGPP
jgi:HK97 family phage portal protein